MLGNIKKMNTERITFLIVFLLLINGCNSTHSSLEETVSYLNDINGKLFIKEKDLKQLLSPYELYIQITKLINL